MPVAFVAFDMLNLEGESVMHEPYWHRRELLESLNLASSHWATTPSFEGLLPALLYRPVSERCALRSSSARSCPGT